MVLQESLIGFASGAVYGVTSLVVGHPLDTLKTKMQAQSSYMTGGPFKVMQGILRNEGLIGLYRGCVPPLLGASALRSAQFGAYQVAHTTLTANGFPQLSVLGIDSKIILSGIFSGFSRTVVECPVEVAKIRRQLGESWRFAGLYKGFAANAARNVPLLTLFFIFVDISKRFDIPSDWRPLLTGSFCSTAAWTLVWPVDVIKTQVQGASDKDSLWTKIRRHYERHGLRGFTRGYGPGAARSFIANGLSMVMYAKTEAFLNSALQDRN
eukprot:TRINITY_DN32035_c0_g1_i1.p1 TRINITY_DN32035_c0_g1~~TRINITY_DN32035_c0_g1_i1.p1  ORF type:complete len:267 (+),score=70.43 TRINITY_DN32035_c0_g1_i1:163-963(+)